MGFFNRMRGALFGGLSGNGIDFKPIKPRRHSSLANPSLLDRVRDSFDYDSPVDNPLTQAGMGLLMQPEYSEEPYDMSETMHDVLARYREMQRQKAEETARERMWREWRESEGPRMPYPYPRYWRR